MMKIKKLAIFFTTTLIATCGFSIKTNNDKTNEYNKYIKSTTKKIESDDEFLITAHRGFSSLEIENTKEALSLASKKDYIDYIEIDARMTKDNKIVLSHDDFIISDDSIELISKQNYDDLINESFNYQSCYISPYLCVNKENELIQKRKKKLNNKEYSIIGLKEGIEACNDKQILLDIKFDNNVEEFTKELQLELQDINTNNITFQSLDIESLKYFKEKTGYDNCLALINCKSDFKYVDDFNNIGIKLSLVNKKQVKKLLDKNKNVAIWTINNDNDFNTVVEKLGDSYQDVIYISDNPDIIATKLYAKQKKKK